MVLLLKIFTIAFLSTNILAQGGTIKGKVIDKESSEVLIGANVIVLLTQLGAATDVNGYYEINRIPPGTYDLRVSYLGYTSVTLQDARVINSAPLIIDFELEEDSTLPSIHIIMEKFYRKPQIGCSPPWSVDMIPIREIYYLNIMERFKLNPPELKPVDLKSLIKDYDK